MYYANDLDGKRICIDDALQNEPYFCPVCGANLFQKRGNRVAHHFAHKPKAECDPWYKVKMSPWHYRMQNLFDVNCREVVIWNDTHTNCHVADVVFQKDGIKYVVEFQHSSISEKEFLNRTDFYTSCGYNIIWVFDFCEHTPPKSIFMIEKEKNLYDTNSLHMDDEDDEDHIDEQYRDPFVHFVWPGKDRIRFLDHIDIEEYMDKLFIFFYISTGKSDSITTTYQGHSNKKWYYINPFDRQSLFALLNIPKYSWDFTTKRFTAKTYTEEEFIKLLR